ncbi:MAG: signal peptidase II [Acutalibacteraceae bacterium]|nr:signal peptidase II [Acutalibacteraceae bacterium]
MLYILAGVVSVLFLVADQITKWYVASNFTLTETKPFINGIIDITYVHNTGGAWGLMQGYTLVLLALTLFIMIICIAMLIKEGFKSKLLFFSVCLIISGGIGNMIDRIFRGGNVVDFIHLHFMPSFPVFNIADCAVCIGAGLLLCYFIADMIKDYKTRRENEASIHNPSDNNGK